MENSFRSEEPVELQAITWGKHLQKWHFENL